MAIIEVTVTGSFSLTKNLEDLGVDEDSLNLPEGFEVSSATGKVEVEGTFERTIELEVDLESEAQTALEYDIEGDADITVEDVELA